MGLITGALTFVGVLMALLLSFTNVAFSSTPTFDGSLGNSFKITLTGNVGSSTLSNVADGQLLLFEIIQDSTGNRTFVWPSNTSGGMDLSQGPAIAANAVVVQMFMYDGTLGVANAVAPGTIN